MNESSPEPNESTNGQAAPLPPPIAMPFPVAEARVARPSLIPRVVGILAMVFSLFGVVFSLAITASAREDIATFGLAGALGSFETWVDIYWWVSLFLLGLHFIGGLASCTYSQRAPKFVTVYAIIAIALAAIDLAMTASLSMPPGLATANVKLPRISLDLIALPWPVVALVLMNLKGAKRACAPRGS